MPSDSAYLTEAARRAALIPTRKVERLVPMPIEHGAVMHVEVRSSDNCISRVSTNVPAPAGMSGHAKATWFACACMAAIVVGTLAAIL